MTATSSSTRQQQGGAGVGVGVGAASSTTASSGYGSYYGGSASSATAGTTGTGSTSSRPRQASSIKPNATNRAVPPAAPGAPPAASAGGSSYYGSQQGAGGGYGGYSASQANPSASQEDEWFSGTTTTTTNASSTLTSTSSSAPAAAAPAAVPGVPAPSYYGAGAGAPSAAPADPFGFSGGGKGQQQQQGSSQQQHNNNNNSDLPYAGSMFDPSLSGPMGGSMTSTKGPVGGGTGTGTAASSSSSYYDNVDFDNEPPLMEELGINMEHIATKSRAVVLPFSRYASSHLDQSVMEDSDLAGPLVFALTLGGELLLSGKVSFGYIYGFGLFGCFALSLVLNLMSPTDAISVWTVTSILGYALLPVNALAGINVLLRISRLGIVGVVLAAVVIVWCTVASTRLFESGCGLRDQRYLVAYPVALIYSAFVIITIF